jgi:hypothetical protein
MTELNTTTTEWTTANIAAGGTIPGTPSREQSGIARDAMELEDPNTPEVVVSKTTNMRDPAIRADRQTLEAGETSLFSDSDVGDLRARWSNLQAEFVDEPRETVQAADELVATVMQRLTEGFARKRVSLENKWDSGETASTEDLRMALQRYRAFFNRLLNAA